MAKKNHWLHRFWPRQLKRWLTPTPQNTHQLLRFLKKSQERQLFSLDTMNMIEGALLVSGTHVREVMIPRAQMVVLQYNEHPDKFIESLVESGHSRFPVVNESRDAVQGILLAKDLLNFYAASPKNAQRFQMRDLLRPPVFIPESKRLNVLLREFRSSRNHMAIVVDEYGGVAGLVTIEDVIEEIIGEIDDEHDLDEENYIRKRSNGCYLVRALTPVDEFNAYFKTSFSDEEFDTIGGVLLQAFGHMPKRGESMELQGFYFEISRTDRRRLHLLEVKRLELKPKQPKQT
ncbi:HlyC/CorC family transporter [Candidatus Venteria ishoeyi]|uniref:Magnesium and cobalt efflux protein CorC n=1 Tax=Candidatus Venteria ishoeyi TaxID=1899563 RepID=A0A1H6FC50_9GAMM|nr:transporter associated domain-containing protein [Candidatus Venteria ishoeyi]SEH04252.1 Magnesium and cobalt efflux protein CorC [Candidatus Venteria ishoeyi]SEH06585.1 Magnesium and cobalt efflux protein CorC [Candidatus Venteria ishoeyi]